MKELYVVALLRFAVSVHKAHAALSMLRQVHRPSASLHTSRLLHPFRPPDRISRNPPAGQQ
jgi:hypothetical protein